MRSPLIATFVVSALANCLLGQPSTCTRLPEDKKKALSDYVRKKYRLPNSVSISLAKDAPILRNCFHELTFEGSSAIKKWELKLYLSPDGRYLTSDLFDTQVDPIEEERRNAQALMASLSENKGSSVGPDHAPVTIIEFSDFECPYCRKFASMMEQIPAAEKSKVRVVFHHLPLSMHPWARAAAVGAGCAQLQNSKAFWALHDQLFREQDQITAGNIKMKLLQFARSTKSLDAATFQSCLDNEMSLGLVFRDMNLASSNDINSTPTLFINGHRLPGVKDSSELRDLIAQAAKETP